MNRHSLAGLDGAAFIDRLTEQVEDASKNPFTNWDGHR